MYRFHSLLLIHFSCILKWNQFRGIHKCSALTRNGQKNFPFLSLDSNIYTERRGYNIKMSNFYLWRKSVKWNYCQRMLQWTKICMYYMSCVKHWPITFECMKQFVKITVVEDISIKEHLSFLDVWLQIKKMHSPWCAFKVLTIFYFS